ncbi:MAG: hypothetical protein AAFZ74_14045 [Pseudomonadota bacterium]
MTSRFGAGLLFFACVALPIIIIDYIRIMSGFDGGPDAPMALRAEYAQGILPAASRGWLFESLAIAFVATAGLIFMDRKSRAGWALAVVGALVTMPMYPVMLGGYSAVLTSPELDAQMFAVLRGIATVVFYIGQALMMLGFALVLGLEISEPRRILPAWLLGLGAIANAIAGLVFLLLHFGLLSSFMIGGPFGIAGFIVMAIYAIGVFRQSVSSGILASETSLSE